MFSVPSDVVSTTPDLQFPASPEALFTYLSGAAQLQLDAERVAATTTHPPCRYVYGEKVYLADAYPLTFYDVRVLALICGGLNGDLRAQHCVLLTSNTSLHATWQVGTRMLELKRGGGGGKPNNQTPSINPALILAFIGEQLAQGHFRPLSIAQ